ncbi:MAG: hypothetical protein KAI39_12440 [Desulfobulbaceae bacterium]|nr:hypothetical protein [Desulfobulbaceae bacterium]
MNNIECHLPPADRTPDKGHDDILGVIKEKLITGFYENDNKRLHFSGHHRDETIVVRRVEL